MKDLWPLSFKQRRDLKSGACFVLIIAYEVLAKETFFFYGLVLISCRY